MKNFLYFILFLISCTAPERKTLDLKANVVYTLTQISITNNDNFSYRNAEIEVDDKYKLTGVTIQPKETYTVDMTEFTDDSGNRMNPLGIKIRKIVIYSETNQGKNGMYLATFK